MDIREFEEFVPVVLERMRTDGYSRATMGTAEWVLGWFARFCHEEGVGDVDEAAVADFCAKRFGFVAGESKLLPTQAAIRKPLLTALELYSTGKYSKHHQPGAVHDVPQCMMGTYSLAITDFVGEQRELSRKTKERKIWIAAKFLTFAAESGIVDIADLRTEDVDAFVESLSGYAPETLRCFKGTLRELLDWMAERGMIGFSGRMAFPMLKKSNRSKILSYYTKEEVERIIACIDPSTKKGKTYLAVVSLLAFTGIRAGDAIALDLDDVDWDAGLIRVVQQKTGGALDIPLPDEVRYPLIDYIRNARPESAEDPDALFVTVHAPHTRMRTTSSLYGMLGRCMRAAGIEPGSRHRGPHSLRHSLATNMLNADVPVSAISDVLGHGSVKTTEIYLTVDLAHARELALEVPL